jgi:RimJ/RimL family protein N-acetyltransferase
MLTSRFTIFPAMSITIIPTAEEHIPGFHRCIDVVARERKYIALTEAAPLDATAAFDKSLINGGGIQVVALDSDDQVVGWCDISQYPFEGSRHCGRLGMGLLPAFRGRGLGERIARDAIQRGWDFGFERIDLDVYAANERARRLYERLGFVVEGVQRRARKIDGAYDDKVLMALFRDAS